MRKLLLMLALSSSMALSAQTVALCWLSLPDSIFPYLRADQRYEILREAQAGNYRTHANLLGDSTRIDTLDLKGGYMRVQATPSMVQELEYHGDTLMLRQTYCSPRCTTWTRWYDPATYRLLRNDLTPFNFTPEELTPYF